MTSVMIRNDDKIMMSLVHYFVTKKNYAPIQVQGVKDEIWLENLNGPYRIIRINCNTILNDEQYKFDIFKMKHIIKQIKKKTMSFKVNTLNICLEMSNKINLDNKYDINTVSVNSLEEVKKNNSIKDTFPDINKELIETSDELDLIINITNDINEKTEKENKMFAKVFSPKKIVITNILRLACLVMYLVLAIGGRNLWEINASTLVKFGANNLHLVKQGELWRLVTCAFLHVNIIHLILNMYALFLIASQVENFIGKYKFIFVYIISIISASLFSLVFQGEFVVSAGASGAIFGLMGALLYFGYHYRLYLNGVVKNQIIPIILLNLLIGYLATGIDNAAHIGGLIGGFLASMVVGVENKSTKRNSINGLIVLILYLVFLSYIVFFVK